MMDPDYSPDGERKVIILAGLVLLAIAGTWVALNMGAEISPGSWIGGMPKLADWLDRPPAVAGPPAAPATPPVYARPPASEAPAAPPNETGPVKVANWGGCQRAVESLGREVAYMDESGNAYLRVNASTVKSAKAAVIDGREVCEIIVLDRDRFGTRITATLYVDAATLFYTRRIERGG